MTPHALGRRKCHRSVAATAIFTIQNLKHAELGGVCLVFENFLVAIAANQPFRVLFVRKVHHVHFAGVGKQYVQVEHLGLSVGPEVDARADKVTFKCFDPVDLIAGSIARQNRKYFGGILKQMQRRICRVMQLVLREGQPIRNILGNRLGTESGLNNAERDGYRKKLFNNTAIH